MKTSSEREEKAMIHAGSCGGCAKFRAAMGAGYVCQGCRDAIRTARQRAEDAIREAYEEWFMIETNQGTYGGLEAVRMVGTADPRWANRDVYERLDGTRRVDGCADADRAPGRVRFLSANAAALAAKRSEVRELERTLADLPTL